MWQRQTALVTALVSSLVLGLAGPAFAQAPPEQAAPAAPAAPAPPAAPAELAPPAAPAEPAPPAQEAPPAPPAPAAPTTPVRPAAGGGIVLDFRDASLDTILEYLSEAAGFIVVRDVEVVDGRITVISRRPVSPEEAVGILNTVLKDKGYAALRTGRTLKIVALTEAKKANVPVRTGNDPEAIEPSDRVVTQVIPLRFVDAVRLRQDIAPLIPTYADLSANASSNALILTDTEANIRRIVEIVRSLDKHLADVADVKVFPLKYASATSAARLINEIFQQQGTGQQGGAAGRGAAGAGAAGRRFRTTGAGGFPGGPGGVPGAGDAQEVGGPSQNVVASADDRTNTLVVSGPPDVLKVVEQVIKELDSNPSSEQAVFIYPLKNAKAANLESVLNELVGQYATTTAGAGGQRGGQSTASMAAAGGQRGGQSTAATAAAAGQRGGASRFTQNQRLSSTAATAVSELAGQVRVVADEDSNSLMVMTASKNFDQMRKIIAELDRSVPQVLIKVLLAEVTHTDSRDLGAEFSVLNLRASGNSHSVFTDFGVAAQSGGLVYKLVDSDVTAALRALQEVGKLDVLSRPYILASSNQAATITVGQSVPFINNTRTTETGQTINTIVYEDIGIILNVTPHINPDGLVIMDVAPEISALTGDTVPISETVDAPVFAKRSAQTRVAIHDGQTIVIGGLMEDKKTDTIRKVPIVGDIPLLGGLFRRTITETSKTELLIFLTPHVAQEATALRGMSEDEMGGSKVVPNAVKPGAFQEHMEGMQRGAAQPEEEKTAKEEKDDVVEVKP